MVFSESMPVLQTSGMYWHGIPALTDWAEGWRPYRPLEGELTSTELSVEVYLNLGFEN
jgi:hypothetical protein